MNDDIRRQLALETENAITEVLVAKTRRALEQYQPKTLIVGGGVTANSYIRTELMKLASKFPEVSLKIPEQSLATDNAVMIALAGYCDFLSGKKPETEIRANGNLEL